MILMGQSAGTISIDYYFSYDYHQNPLASIYSSRTAPWYGQSVMPPPGFHLTGVSFERKGRSCRSYFLKCTRYFALPALKSHSGHSPQASVDPAFHCRRRQSRITGWRLSFSSSYCSRHRRKGSYTANFLKQHAAKFKIVKPSHLGRSTPFAA
jgi:hypothetical protein